MTQWGEKIVVDCKKPEWLKDSETFYAFTGQTEIKVPGGHTIRWTDVQSIVLPVDHPYYTATNAGFIYWPGGTMAPHDWDGWVVLLRNGRRMQPHPSMKPLDWSHDQYGSGIMDSDIIGYKKKVETIDGIPYSDVLCILDAVRAGDMEKARACLPVDPVVERARELYKKRCPIPIDETSLSFQVTCDALREGMGDA